MKKILLIALGVVLLFTIVSSITTKVIYDMSFPRFDRHDDTITTRLRYEDVEPFFERETVTFESLDNTLQGYVYHQDGTHGLVVIAHGLGGGADSYLSVAKWFLDAGWSVFMYDATGSYDSEGDSTRGFPQSLIDLENALEYLDTKERFDGMARVLYGHSWGGYAVANSLHLFDDIAAIVSVAAPASADGMIFERTENILGPFAFTQKPFVSLYQRLLFGEYAAYDAIEAFNESTAHIMVIHGVEDDTVGYDKSSIISRRSEVDHPNATFITRDDPGRNDHDNLMRSASAVAYIEDLNTVYRTLHETHDGSIPHETKQAFYAEVDRFQAQALDETLMERIHAMYLEALDE